MLQFAASKLGSKVQLAPLTENLWESVMAVPTPKLGIGDTTVDYLLSCEQRGKVMMKEIKTSSTGSHISGEKQFNPIGKSQ